jgi:hypothetical protein
MTARRLVGNSVVKFVISEPRASYVMESNNITLAAALTADSDEVAQRFRFAIHGLRPRWHVAPARAHLQPTMDEHRLSNRSGWISMR